MRRVLGLALCLALAGCGGGGGSGSTLERGPMVAGFEFTEASAVAEGEAVDVRYTCDGEDVSPALAWKGVPEGTKELALVVDDPDAPGGTFTHWLLWGLDAAMTSLPEGVGSSIASLVSGKNDFGSTGYGGPCPPRGPRHRYVFRLLALRNPVALEPGVDRPSFDQAVAPHVIAEARLTATYARK